MRPAAFGNLMGDYWAAVFYWTLIAGFVAAIYAGLMYNNWVIVTVGTVGLLCPVFLKR